jgi:Tfp pilus assembly protein PilF/class 3 adenylate cyclase
MADLNKMERTWLCSVVFMDIARYSSQSVELQMKWKKRFNGYLEEAIRDVPESERVILDTGDGAAICFLGAPEAAMFAALQLCGCFEADEREQAPGLRVRLGINLGPVKLIKDINGALNAIGDGMNAGQRIMSFAAENQILVSQSFFEVVSRLSDDYKLLFQLKGVETDKHVREYTVYHLIAPGSERREPIVANAGGQGAPAAPARAIGVAASPEHRAPQNRSVSSSMPSWRAAGAALVVLAVVGAWYFHRSSVPALPNLNTRLVGQSQASAPPDQPPAGKIAEPSPAAPIAVEHSDKPESPAHPAETRGARVEAAPIASAQPENPPALPEPEPEPEPVARPESPATPLSADAKAAYAEAMRLLDQDKPAEATRHFDDALRASPDYVDAYIGRAEARRLLVQYELSIEDCKKIIQIRADDPRGYNCRGSGYQLLKQYEPALRDFNEAIRLNPGFAMAYSNRGGAYSGLQQYDRAVQDYSQAIHLRPRNVLFHQKRAAAYNSLKQYDKAIKDYTEAIRLQPNDLRAYLLRASSEDASGDSNGADADRRHVRESRKRK